MDFFAWLHHLNKYLRNGLGLSLLGNSQKESIQQNSSNKTLNKTLNKKCKSAAQEIGYINNFTYWPIAKVKAKAKVSPIKNSLVYLKVKRVKHEPFIHHHHKNNKNVTSINKNM